MIRNVEGFTYYSNTYDVCTWGDEEQPLQITASFADRTEAIKYVRANGGGVAFIRPPAATLRDALAWVAYLGDVASVGYNDPEPAVPTLR